MTSTQELGLTAGTWTIDPSHSEVSFAIRHLMTKVRGVFTNFSGTVEVADDLARSTATAQIEAASVDTRNADRDAHVRGNDILGSEQHPHLVFETTGVRTESGKNFVDGTLTVKGVTRPVTLEVEFHGVGADPWGGTRAGFTATTRISRKDFGVDFNMPVGEGALLGDAVDITLEIQAVKA
jgi:polyisoprenoid-binding protein YceI